LKKWIQNPDSERRITHAEIVANVGEIVGNVANREIEKSG
jgi:hypothetical protein